MSVFDPEKPPELAENEKKFIGAFLSTARRDAHVASVQAGLGMTPQQATAMLARPAVRYELERLSMVGKFENGELVDVKPLHPLAKEPPTDPVARARAALQAHMAIRASAENENGVMGASEPRGNLSGPDAPGGGQRGGHDMDTRHEPISQGQARRALRHAEILTETGKVAGTVQEVYERVRKAQTRKNKKGGSINRPVKQKMNGDALVTRLEQAQKENVAQDRGDGALYIVSQGEVCTPYEIKKFLTQGMKGTFTYEPTIRVQCAALLAKVLGMLDPKQIERERQLDQLAPETETDIRKEIENTQREILRLKGEVE